MPRKERKKKKEKLKEKRRKISIKYQRAAEEHRAKIEKSISKKGRRFPKKFAAFSFLLVIIILVSAIYAWQQNQPQTSTSSQNQSGANTSTLYTLTSSDLSEFRGKPVILEFFTTYCTACPAQIPELAKIKNEYDDQVVILSVAPSTESPAELEQYKENHNITWLLARDTVGLFDKYRISGVPTIVILDQNGNVYFIHEGVTSSSVMSNKIDELLKK